MAQVFFDFEGVWVFFAGGVTHVTLLIGRLLLAIDTGMFKKVIDCVIAFVVAVAYWALSRTWRVSFRGTPAHDVVTGARIYAHWHGDELLLIGSHSFAGMAVLSSHSREGTRLAYIFSLLGFSGVRGSSSRGGAGGLKALIRTVTSRGCDASLAVDGPRGPRFQVKTGVVKLAQLTGRPLMPGAAAARSKHVFEKAWNRCYLPFPFSRCVVLYGDPISIPRGVS